MIKNVATLPREAKIRTVGKMIADYAVGSVLIIDDCERPVGIITARDIVKRVIACRTADPLAETAGEIMSQPLICVSQESTMRNAAGLMFKHNIKRLPVLGTTGKLVGLITKSELLDTFENLLDEDTVTDYINEVVKVLEVLKTSRELPGKSSDVPEDEGLPIKQKNELITSDMSAITMNDKKTKI